MLNAVDITVGYGENTILNNLTVEFPEGKITAIIGPNGSGKSTLLRAFCRLSPLRSGHISVQGQNHTKFGSKEFARTVALLPQHPIAPEGITVRELVHRGRYPHQGLFHSASSADKEIVEWAMQQTNVIGFADRPCASLSGGQRQRVWVAMVLAQQTPIIFLDEPTTYLDMSHQIELLDLISELVEKRNLTVVTVLHELNMAARCAHNIVAVKDGSIAAQGTPEEVLTRERCQEIFGLDAVVLHDPEVSKPVVAGRKRTIFEAENSSIEKV